MTLQVLHFPLTDINLRTQLPPPFSSPALLCLLTVPLLEIHFSRFLCRCSQFSRSTHTRTQLCVRVSRFCFIFSPFFYFLVFWFHTKFGSACYMPRYFLLQRRRRLLPSEHHRLWAALWTARCLVFNPIFIVSTHLSLARAWPGINGTRNGNGNGNVEGAFSLEFQQQQQPQQPRQLYGRLIKIKRTVSSFGF